MCIDVRVAACAGACACARAGAFACASNVHVQLCQCTCACSCVGVSIFTTLINAEISLRVCKNFRHPMGSRSSLSMDLILNLLEENALLADTHLHRHLRKF